MLLLLFGNRLPEMGTAEVEWRVAPEREGGRRDEWRVYCSKNIEEINMERRER